MYNTESDWKVNQCNPPVLRLKRKNHIMVSTDSEKLLDMIQDPSMIKKKEDNFLNLLKAIDKKTTVNTVFNGEQLNALLLSQEWSKAQKYTITTAEVLARARSQEKRINDIQIGKEEIKLSLFIVDRIVYAKKNITDNPSEIKNIWN